MKLNVLGMSFDSKSLRFKLWVYFALFAVLIMVLLWFLQIYFLHYNYEEMKIAETNRIAQALISNYGQENFTEFCANVSSTSDIYIHVEEATGSVIYSPMMGEDTPPAYMYFRELRTTQEELIHSKNHTVSLLLEDATTDYNTLAYAREIESTREDGSVVNVRFFIFSPLYPVESTITILTHQLVYVTIISLVFSLMLGIFLAGRIARPLHNITESAKELARGKYGTVFHGENYTEIINLADTLTYTSVELEKSNALQKDIMANVSHDLKTPLTMVKSYAEMIRDLSGDNPEKRNAHLQVIIDEADRLNHLVNDMLSLSRLQTGAMIIEKKPFSIKEVAESIVQSYAIFCEQEGYSILLDCPSDVTVEADEGKIKQVLSNLINNAVKYCGSDRLVIVSIKTAHGHVRCEVTDHGMGIAPEELDNIWDRYYKASTNHVRTTSGSGLGLSIVKEIILLHGGTYGVKSEQGKGSTFWFELAH